ncbi:MAG: OadG family transporter subunit [Treponema sp.]
MTIGEMLAQSGVLTLLGIGIVFVFIIIQILALKAVEIGVRALGLDKEEIPAQTAVQNTGTGQAVAAVIAAALYERDNQ